MTPDKIYKNILVFNPSYLGDTILTTPLIRALRQLYPDASISFCVRPEHKGLFQKLELINNVITYDKRKSESGIKGICSIASKFRSYNFDLIINLHKSARSSAVFLLLRKPYIIGFKSAFFSFIFNKTVERIMTLQEAERNLMVLSALCSDFTLEDAKNIGGGLTCYINSELKEKILRYYYKTTNTKKVIGIACGSVWKTKCWPAEYFAQTAHILNNDGYAIALFGGPGDEDAISDFKKNYRGFFYDFSLKTSMSELPSFLSSLDLLITNDSGPMHAAIAGGVTCAAIFGATVKSLGFFPYDKKSIVIENNNLSCRPCGRHGGNSCPKGHFKCMRDILPAAVADKVKKIMGNM